MSVITQVIKNSCNQCFRDIKWKYVHYILKVLVSDFFHSNFLFIYWTHIRIYFLFFWLLIVRVDEGCTKFTIFLYLWLLCFSCLFQYLYVLNKIKHCLSVLNFIFISYKRLNILQWKTKFYEILSLKSTFLKSVWFTWPYLFVLKPISKNIFKDTLWDVNINIRHWTLNISTHQWNKNVYNVMCKIFFG